MKLGQRIGIGNTAIVYEWEEGRVLKLFKPGYPRQAVEREYENARAIENMDFPKVRAYELIVYDGRPGIVYEKVEGESLLDWLMRTGDIKGCAAHMSKLHKKIIQSKVSGLLGYKEFLKNSIEEAGPLKDKEKVLKMLGELPSGNTLCHGDFHPGNIFISGGQTRAIDFMNVCEGHFLYDIARTTFLIEYSPVPAETETEDKEMLLDLKKTLVDLYLAKMDVSRVMIQEYIPVLMAARIGESLSSK